MDNAICKHDWLILLLHVSWWGHNTSLVGRSICCGTLAVIRWSHILMTTQKNSSKKEHLIVLFCSRDHVIISWSRWFHYHMIMSSAYGHGHQWLFCKVNNEFDHHIIDISSYFDTLHKIIVFHYDISCSWTGNVYRPVVHDLIIMYIMYVSSDYPTNNVKWEKIVFKYRNHSQYEWKAYSIMDNMCEFGFLFLCSGASPDGWAVWRVVLFTRWWFLVDHCVLRNWDRILDRAVNGLISRAGMVSICPLLWQRDVKLQQTILCSGEGTWLIKHYVVCVCTGPMLPCQIWHVSWNISWMLSSH